MRPFSEYMPADDGCRFANPTGRLSELRMQFLNVKGFEPAFTVLPPCLFCRTLDPIVSGRPFPEFSPETRLPAAASQSLGQNAFVLPEPRMLPTLFRIFCKVTEPCPVLSSVFLRCRRLFLRLRGVNRFLMEHRFSQQNRLSVESSA